MDKNRIDIKTHIVTEAGQLFRQFGFKSVTMDDLSKQLCVSKKTIYQYFRDKDELINLLIDRMLDARKADLLMYADKAADALEELFMGLDNAGVWFDSLDPMRIYDLQKYHHDAWIKIQQFMEGALSFAISNNLLRGQREGIFREDIHVGILTDFRIGQIQWIVAQQVGASRKKYTTGSVVAEITKHYLHGIANKKGAELIKKYSKDIISNG